MPDIALYGGKPVRRTCLSYGHQYIDEDDIQAVIEVMKSDFLTCGPKVPELETALCRLTGAAYCTAVANGTAALHVACLAAGISPGDEVITTPITFAASANAVLYCGGKPVFADIDPKTYTIDPTAIEQCVTERTKAVIAVDFTGAACDYGAIRTICEKHHLLLIEDAAHSIGTTYRGTPVGSIADFTTFSFHPVKTITAGEGGAVVMEPIRNDYPQNGFLTEIRRMTSEAGISLIFDEISSGFRMCCGGSHLVLGVEPDIAVFAKAMTNGYPIAAVIGRKAVMTAAQDTFISSTFWTERIALTAAVKSIQEYRRQNVSEYLMKIGKRVQEGWAEQAKAAGLQIEVGGIYPLSHFAFCNDQAMACKTYFTQEMLHKGYLAYTGYYASLAHTEKIVEDYLTACGQVFRMISKLLKGKEQIAGHINGPVCHTGFQRLN